MTTERWFCKRGQWKLWGCVAFVGASLVGNSSLAQIVPDTTLGRESSVVAPNVNIQGLPSDLIDGGAIRGANLFHSFDQFNVGAGRGVYFTNPVGIENILSRVTGANRSDILGRLGVLGTANLFLINPRGIVFGVDSSLDVQGSFLATTANAAQLGDRGLFSASQPAESILLAVSPSAFWFNAVAAQPIVNRSQSTIGQPNSAGLAPGLQVQPERTIALIGGDVLIEGGRLNAPSGRIELGSVAGEGNVSLTQSGNRFVFGYDSTQNFGTIAFSDRAFVDASGEGGGDIQVRGARFDMVQGSSLRANTLGAKTGGALLIRTTETTLREGSVLSTEATETGTGTSGNITIETRSLTARDGTQVTSGTLGAGKGGNLQVTASEFVELVGMSANGELSSGLFAQSEGSGDAGDLTLKTGRLIVRDGAQVSAGTTNGKGGNLQVNANSVEVIGESADGRVGSGLFASTQGSGDAQNLRIDTGRLIVRDGAQVSAISTDTGKGGNLQINASDSVELSGRSADGQFNSGLLTQSEGSGNAGDVRIDTGRLIVRDGATISTVTFGAGKGGNLQINASDSVELSGRTANSRSASSVFASTQGSGDAGNLRIDTARLTVRDGTQIATGTQGAGKGGSLQINASDSIELIGRSVDGLFSSGLFGQSQGSGDAGDLSIDTNRLRISDGATLSSASVRGTAGNINITARDTLQANNGTIETRARRSAGGAITINAGAIRLFGNSDIRSDVASGFNNGGTITLDAGSILAFNDSDILAFARDGRGGNIILNTPAFFGENYRPALGETNPNLLNNNRRVDVNATGAISGTITLPDVTFIQNSLVELPETQINTDTLLANSCIVRRDQPTRGSFTITGTGGLPQRPGEAQMSSFPTADVEMLPQTHPPSTRRTWQKGDPITEPQGVYRLPDGKLVLSRNCR